MKLSLFNSLTRKKEIFSPIDPNFVKMYVCGPTVYDHPHIGNARSVVIYDVLYRILVQIYDYENVRYVRNITDVDDKIIVRAKEMGVPISEVTKMTIDFFHQDMDFLGCVRPNVSPKATEHINEMIKIIQILLEKDAAYEAKGDIYFDVSKAIDYHQLSGRDFDKAIEGTRPKNNPDKKNPADFALWKKAMPEDEEGANFESPFGLGRPGWHIECSAMSHKYLGENFDIHGGGADLIFPHHTNEIAQSRCAFPDSKFAHMWVHNGFLTVNHEKMSKSLGNFITVKDLIDKGQEGEVIRLVLLGNHYRKPLDYNDKAGEDAYKTLSYWYRAMENLDEIDAESAIPREFFESLLDDMNITMAIKLINDYAKEAHLAASEGDLTAQKEAARKMLSSAKFLGLLRKNPQDWFKKPEESDEIEAMLEERSKAKEAKDWALADQIRAKIEALGVILEDKPGSKTIWRKR